MSALYAQRLTALDPKETSAAIVDTTCARTADFRPVPGQGEFNPEHQAGATHAERAPRHCCAGSGRRGLHARNLRLLTRHQRPPANIRAKWIEKTGFHRLATLLRSPTVARRVFRVAAALMVVLVFIGGVGVGRWWSENTAPSVVPPPVASPPIPQPKWSDQEIAVRSDLWHSIQNAVNAVSSPAGPVVAAYNYGDYMLNIWENYIPKNRTDYLGALKEFRKRVSDAADIIRKLRTDYPNFKDVSETIDQPYLGPLLDSIDNFSTAISALPEPLPPNYQTTLRKPAGDVRVQMNAFADWINNVQSTSKAKLNQLQMMGHK